MANVVISILSVLITIGLALVGASYFGDEAMLAAKDANATSYLSRLTIVASATKIYNRDAVPPAAATTSLAFLSSYGVDSRTLPNGTQVRLLSATGGATGTARFAAASLGNVENDAGRMCSSILSMMSNSGATEPPVLSAWPTNDTRGCFKAGTTVGPFAAGQYVVFIGI